MRLSLTPSDSTATTSSSIEMITPGSPFTSACSKTAPRSTTVAMSWRATAGRAVERDQRGSGNDATRIEVADHTWVQNRQQAVEVAAFAGVHETCDHEVVLGAVDLKPCDSLVGFDPASGPARKLATRLGRTADEFGDGVEVES